MSPDPEAAGEALQRFKELAHEEVWWPWRRGRIVYEADDWVLAVFQKVLPAFRAAKNLAWSFPHAGFDHRGCRVRVGLAWGEIRVSRTGEVRGPAVDLAVQYEAVSPAQSVRYSPEAGDQLRKERDSPFHSLKPSAWLDALKALAWYDPLPDLDRDYVRRRLAEKRGLPLPTLDSVLAEKGLR